MATSTKQNKKSSAASGPENRSGLPNSTVQRANLGGGNAGAIGYRTPDSDINLPPSISVGGAESPEATGAGIDEISLRAYYLGERRRNEGLPGDEVTDWLQAENELLGSTRQ